MIVVTFDKTQRKLDTLWDSSIQSLSATHGSHGTGKGLYLCTSNDKENNLMLSSDFD